MQGSSDKERLLCCQHFRRPKAFHAGGARERQQDGFGRLARSLGRRRDDSSSAAHSVACAAFLVCWEDSLRAWCWFALPIILGDSHSAYRAAGFRASCHAARTRREWAARTTMVVADSGVP